LYGFYIWFRGESNVSDYPWAGNFMYAAQRWTGGIAFIYIIWHTYTMRFSGTHLLAHPDLAFDKVQTELQHWWAGVFYLAGIIAASWHFSYGIYLFCAKWGITVSERSRKWMGRACTVLAFTLIIVGWVTMAAFFRPQWQDHWKNAPTAEQSVKNTGH
jgi:succinate dehydrogenase / fumarate reductase cytochrome b subunit